MGPGSYTLTISAVPEPATYGMMLAGLGLVGVALRRRQS
ncbi:PEP-CTERM sorting domain-containing protein [Pseudoduganella albidiflava]|uniref:PEP-CTERM sorting domain-containing protein n=2 Tax=Pseudoduganella TaxID=1522432 RepID=A0ABX5S496_9BURK|nr:PEP-CTERM sorting domain-containing protein [Pseudoduganella albidiflava]